MIRTVDRLGLLGHRSVEIVRGGTYRTVRITVDDDRRLFKVAEIHLTPDEAMQLAADLIQGGDRG